MLAGTYVYEEITAEPHWVYLHSLGNDGKVITVFYPKSFGSNNELYIIPGKYTSTSLPDSNYVKTHPYSEVSLNINWQPNDGRELKFEYPLKDGEYENHLDTTRFMVSGNGQPYLSYMDKGDTFYSPKYRGFEYYEWIIHGRNDSSQNH